MVDDRSSLLMIYSYMPRSLYNENYMNLDHARKITTLLGIRDKFAIILLWNLSVRADSYGVLVYRFPYFR